MPHARSGWLASPNLLDDGSGAWPDWMASFVALWSERALDILGPLVQGYGEFISWVDEPNRRYLLVNVLSGAIILKDRFGSNLLKNSVSAQGRKISGDMARLDHEVPRACRPTAIALCASSRFAYAKTCPQLSLSTPRRRKKGGRNGKPSFSTE
jgi:hypothetical protein